MISLLQVAFVSEESGEYQFYNVQFRSTSATTVDTINLTSAVRQSTSHTITIDNPFPTPVNMVTYVNVPTINISNNFQIKAESQVRKIGELLVKHLFGTSCWALKKATTLEPEHFGVIIVVWLVLQLKTIVLFEGGM